MIKWILSLFEKVDKPTKMVALWNGKQLQHWALTEDQYDTFMSTPLPFGFSVISVMEL